MPIALEKIANKWLFEPFRWGIWVVDPGPRMWWRLFVDSKATAVSSVLAPSLGTLLTALIARLLGSEQYGRLATLTVYTGWFGVIASYPTASLVASFIAEGRQQGTPYRRKCATGLILALALGLAATLAALLLLPRGLAYYQVPEQRLAGIMLCFSFVLAPPSSFCLVLLQAMGRLRLWAALNVFFYVVLMGCVALAGWLIRPFSIEVYLAAVTIAGVINAVTGLLTCVRVLTLHDLLRPDLSVIRPQAREGFGGWVASLANTLGAMGLNTLIVKCAGRTELGFYQLAATVGAWVYSVVTSVTVPALPRWSALAARGGLSTVRRDMRLRQTATGSFQILLAILVLFFAPQILTALYGPDYRACVTLLSVSVGYWIAIGFGCWYWTALTAMGHPGMVMLPNVIWCALALTTTWVLISLTPIGAVAAMVGQVVGHVGWVLSYEVMFRKSIRLETTAGVLEGPDY